MGFGLFFPQKTKTRATHPRKTNTLDSKYWVSQGFLTPLTSWNPKKFGGKKPKRQKQQCFRAHVPQTNHGLEHIGLLFFGFFPCFFFWFFDSGVQKTGVKPILWIQNIGFTPVFCTPKTKKAKHPGKKQKTNQFRIGFLVFPLVFALFWKRGAKKRCKTNISDPKYWFYTSFCTPKSRKKKQGKTKKQ